MGQQCVCRGSRVAIVRIAVVHSFYSADQPSGENRVVEDQVHALRRAGHDVELIALHTDQESAAWTFEVRSAFRVATGHGRSPLARLRSFRPEIVHVHNLFPNFGSSWISAWPGPVVVTLHNFRTLCSNGVLFRNGSPCEECPQRGAWRAVAHACYRGSRIATLPVALGRRVATRDLVRRPSAIVTTSETFDNELRRLIPDVGRTVIIPNFVPGLPDEPLQPNLRQSWVALGRMTPEKGFRQLVEAWPEQHPLTLIGDGPQRSEIVLAAAQRPITIKMPIPIEHLRQELPRFRGLIIPSQWAEAAPQVVVEAMRVGLPVIAHRLNGVAEIVAGTGAGAVYEDQRSLREAIALVDADLQDMSTRAVRCFSELWLESTWVTRVEHLYRQLASP
jgi:glycosyltransferase involved in cell wall biosynthesis